MFTKSSNYKKKTAVIALSLLVLHNSASILLQHQVQSQSDESDKRHDPLTAIMLCEMVKLTASALLVAKQNASSLVSSSARYILRPLRWNALTVGHTDAALPAALYTFATFLQSVGAYNLDLLPYLMLSQAKVIITPLLVTLFLNQKFTGGHWICFLLVMVGVNLVQTAPADTPPTPSSRPQDQTQIRGAAAMLLSGFCVALAGVQVEKMLQTGHAFMARNAQLAWYSFVSASLVYIWLSQPGPINFFQGYDTLVWGFILLQATCGFLVAWCVAVTSTVTKNHAQVVGFLMATKAPLLVQRRVNLQHLCGAILAAGALLQYARQTPESKGTMSEEPAEKGYTLV
ncbi:nucleotide-sugar transporter-domain-containing protein [Aspergillus tetrazonus]